MTAITASSVNDLQILLCRNLLTEGSQVEPRGMPTLELMGVSFEITNPRMRLTTLEHRKWSGALAVAELAWNLRGDKDVDALAFYTPRWRDFADVDGKVRGSCYGARVFGHNSCESQWRNVQKLLRDDPASRRAVLNFRVEEDVSRTTNDVSCTNTLQFILRDNRLHAFVNMRSNDAIWGVPYDVFLFTCMQELMALELGVELGSYYHYSSSMHVYERHYQVAKLISSIKNTTFSGEMPAMKDAACVYELAQQERSFRLTGTRPIASFDAFKEKCLDMLSLHKNLAAVA